MIVCIFIISMYAQNRAANHVVKLNRWSFSSLNLRDEYVTFLWIYGEFGSNPGMKRLSTLLIRVILWSCLHFYIDSVVCTVFMCKEHNLSIRKSTSFYIPKQFGHIFSFLQLPKGCSNALDKVLHDWGIFI